MEGHTNLEKLNGVTFITGISAPPAPQNFFYSPMGHL